MAACTAHLDQLARNARMVSQRSLGRWMISYRLIEAMHLVRAEAALFFCPAGIKLDMYLW